MDSWMEKERAIQNVTAGTTEKEEELEKEVWRCLNSVHSLLLRREILNQTLRQGWMELVSARYQMGPARICHPLFSLKPQAAKAVVDVKLNPSGGDSAADNVEGGGLMSIKGPVIFELIKDNSEREQKAGSDAKQGYSDLRQKKPSSQLRRRPVSTLTECTGDEKDVLLQNLHLISDSDSEDDVKPLEVPKNNLQGFGTIVSQQLRSAQGTFFKALALAVELINAQNEAVDAHSVAFGPQTSTNS